MIAGSNVEVTNRLTLARRPGNPQYDGTNAYSNIIAFDEFRYSKSLSDIWGSTLETIDVMVDTTTALYANNNGVSQEVWAKTTGAGQDFMQTVGDELYFGNGIDQKKWLQSLFVRDSGNDSSILSTDAYPFMDTYLIDPNNNIQQLIGAQIAVITAASCDADILTITISAPLGGSINGAPFFSSTTGDYDQAVGTFFTIWGLTGDADVLNGNTLALTDQYITGDTTLTFSFESATNFNVTGMDGILQIADGITSGVTDTIGDVTITAGTTTTPGPQTGSSVPTWGTTVPTLSNNFQGSITVDGNLVWVNRGSPVENWGIAPPVNAPTYTATGTSVGWQANTYYSLGSIYQDNVSGYLWQISTPGMVGATQPTWPSAPTVQAKFDIIDVYILANVVFCTTSTQSVVPGDVITLQYLVGANFLNSDVSDLNYTILTATSTSISFAFTNGNYGSAADPIPDVGYGVENVLSPHPPTTQDDGTAVWVAIQTPASLTWAPNTHRFQNDFIQATPASGTVSYFQLQKNQEDFYPTPNPFFTWPPGTAPTTAPITSEYFSGGSTGGQFNIQFPAGSPTSTQTPASLYWQTPNYPAFSIGPLDVYPVNGAGKVDLTSGVSIGDNNGGWAITASVYIAAPGLVTFVLTHDDGAFFSFNDTTGDYLSSGSFTEGTLITPAHTVTAVNGWGNQNGASNLAGQNNQTSANTPKNTPWVTTATWFFATAGQKQLEIDYANWNGGSSPPGTPGQMIFQRESSNIATTPDTTGATTPVWPAFTTAGATYNSTQKEIIFGTADIVADGSQYTWVNLGPVANFGWTKNLNYTLPDTTIVDSNGNEEGPISTGFTGTTAPKWNTGGLNSLTLDNGSLVWINEGPIPLQPTTTGRITATSSQGWIYAIALVNTLDNTVSNIGPVSASTGPIVNGQVVFAPGAGLAGTTIDPQADYVAIFRTADGFSTELLIPGNGNTIYTIPLSTYLTYGYVDQTPDTGLDQQAEAPAADENTPPLPGAINLAYHLNRIFFSIGNTVFWTSGPDDPIGNGINGFGPDNFDKMPSLVKKLVPTAVGLLVFTVSDVYCIPDNGQGGILPSYAYLPGVGLSSYNALDINGATIGFFTTDSQFLALSPAVGCNIESVPIADQLALKNGTPGQNWLPANVFVASYVSGQDMGWFIADGTNGWFRLINNPAPETGSMSWSPFAQLANTGACGAIKSVETSPGVHHLLIGPRGSGVYILNRDVNSSTDGGPAGVYNEGTPYPAYAVLGSFVLAQPGQIANVQFVTLKSVLTGSPAIIGLLLDDGLPYYKGSFEMLKNWVNDPPTLKKSRSWYTQRFYLSDMPTESAAVTDMQIMVQWPAEAALNELQTWTIFGFYVQEE